MQIALLIIGGGPAALAAARGYRSAGGRGTVTLIADEHRAPYSRPPLTKDYLRGQAGVAALPLESTAWYTEQRVSVIASRVVAVDPRQRTARLEDGRELKWEQLVLATGSAPGRPPLEGADLPGVVVVRTAADVDALLSRLGRRRPAIVIGSGFIGCEIGASLRRREHAVDLIAAETVPQRERLGDDVGSRIGDWLREEGVAVIQGTPAASIRVEGSQLVVDAAGRRRTGDVVIMAAGAVPRLELAAGLGLDVSAGGFDTDSSMRTKIDGVFAAGDACRAVHSVAGRALQTEHWGDALAQGEVAGRVAAGDTAQWDEIPGFWSTIGDRTLKHAAWGDGWDRVELEDRPRKGFAARYWQDDRLVGVLTYNADDDYALGREQLARG